MRYRQRILYPRGTVPALAKRFGVSEVTVRSALRFATEGEQPNLIREAAIRDFGAKMAKVPVIGSTKEVNT